MYKTFQSEYTYRYFFKKVIINMFKVNMCIDIRFLKPKFSFLLKARDCQAAKASLKRSEAKYDVRQD